MRFFKRALAVFAGLGMTGILDGTNPSDGNNNMAVLLVYSLRQAGGNVGRP